MCQRQTTMTNNNTVAQSLSEATAIRLFNSVATTDETIRLHPRMDRQKSIESVGSVNEFGNSCRICRWNRSDMQILQCPCHCKGTVGFVHMQCLKRWIIHRRIGQCEICNEHFALPVEKLSISRMIKNFWTQCAGSIMKHALYSASLLPLAHVVLQQVLFCMETINQGAHEQLTISEILMASCALLTSSALFFHFLEFVTTRFLIIRNILRQWWTFGSSSDYTLEELDSELFDFL